MVVPGDRIGNQRCLRVRVGVDMACDFTFTFVNSRGVVSVALSRNGHQTLGKSRIRVDVAGARGLVKSSPWA